MIINPPNGYNRDQGTQETWGYSSMMKGSFLWTSLKRDLTAWETSYFLDKEETFHPRSSHWDLTLEDSSVCKTLENPPIITLLIYFLINFCFAIEAYCNAPLYFIFFHWNKKYKALINHLTDIASLVFHLILTFNQQKAGELVVCQR